MIDINDKSLMELQELSEIRKIDISSLLKDIISEKIEEETNPNLYSDRKRFWKAVDKKKQNECWPYLGCTDKKSGYGVAVLGKKSNHAHRIAYILATGEQLTSKIVIRHTCDNRICCNPGHLVKGTAADNVRDRIERKGDQQGEHNCASKYTEDQVAEVRRLAKEGMPNKDIESKLGMSKGSVSLIIRGVTWKHSFSQEQTVQLNWWNPTRAQQKFTPEQIKNIRDRYSQNERISKLAKEFNVGRTTIEQIVKRKTYRRIP